MQWSNEQKQATQKRELITQVLAGNEKPEICARVALFHLYEVKQDLKKLMM